MVVIVVVVCVCFVLEQPARVTIYEIPSRRELRQKNLFSVETVKMIWHPQGDYLAAIVTRFTKTRKSEWGREGGNSNDFFKKTKSTSLLPTPNGKKKMHSTTQRVSVASFFPSGHWVVALVWDAIYDRHVHWLWVFPRQGAWPACWSLWTREQVWKGDRLCVGATRTPICGHPWRWSTPWCVYLFAQGRQGQPQNSKAW